MSRPWLTYLCIGIGVLVIGTGTAAVSVVVHNNKVRAEREEAFERYWRAYLAVAIDDAPFVAIQLKANVKYDVDAYYVGGWLVEQAAAEVTTLDWSTCPPPFNGGNRFGPANEPGPYASFRKSASKMAKLVVAAKQAIRTDFVAHQAEPFVLYCARLDSEGREPLVREKDKIKRFAELVSALDAVPSEVRQRSE